MNRTAKGVTAIEFIGQEDLIGSVQMGKGWKKMAGREKIEKGLRICTSKEPCNGCPYLNERNCSLSMVADALAMLKEQEAEAKWIYGEDKTGVDGWYCSECNFFEPWFYEFTEDIDFIRFYGHCPKCGRRMTSYTGKPTQERR